MDSWCTDELVKHRSRNVSKKKGEDTSLSHLDKMFEIQPGYNLYKNQHVNAISLTIILRVNKSYPHCQDPDH